MGDNISLYDQVDKGVTSILFWGGGGGGWLVICFYKESDQLFGEKKILISTICLEIINF